MRHEADHLTMSSANSEGVLAESPLSHMPSWCAQLSTAVTLPFPKSLLLRYYVALLGNGLLNTFSRQ
jgi:hypothetical protein